MVGLRSCCRCARDMCKYCSFRARLRRDRVCNCDVGNCCRWWFETGVLIVRDARCCNVWLPACEYVVSGCVHVRPCRRATIHRVWLMLCGWRLCCEGSLLTDWCCCVSRLCCVVCGWFALARAPVPEHASNSKRCVRLPQCRREHLIMH